MVCWTAVRNDSRAPVAADLHRAHAVATFEEARNELREGRNRELAGEGWHAETAATELNLQNPPSLCCTVLELAIQHLWVCWPPARAELLCAFGLLLDLGAAIELDDRGGKAHAVSPRGLHDEDQGAGVRSMEQGKLHQRSTLAVPQARNELLAFLWNIAVDRWLALAHH